ncbi:MAG: DoxX family protein [Candidatus Latescibacteria bacterium]|nr:DoxX family protein [Candidatus Latescibacterota bacterium]
MKDTIKRFFKAVVATSAPYSVGLIRLMVGAVFLSEGIQKFLYPDSLGVGRFITIGIPFPEILAPFVGVFEITCGFLMIPGIVTRLVSVPLIIIMIVAIFTTKIPILINNGFWEMAHAARTDFSMLLGSLYILIVGAGGLSVDKVISCKIK